MGEMEQARWSLPVNVFEVCQVGQTLDNVMRHAGQPPVRHLVQLLSEKERERQLAVYVNQLTTIGTVS
jgi:hypothetical protein